MIKKNSDIAFSKITPKEIYLNRRQFIGGIWASGAAWTTRGFISDLFLHHSAPQSERKLQYILSDLSTRGEKLTPYEDVTTFNNFYEFGTGKKDPSKNATEFKTDPWTVSIEGHVKKSKTYDVNSVIKMHPSLEERIYRFRCVETWSMVIPWIGIPLSSVIKAVEPTSKAKFVMFETLYDPKQMPGQRRQVIKWPYVEGLRMDEAVHPLTILAVGLYGEIIPNQNGAPLRLVVPWKYGFKSIKSIVKIKFVENQPNTSWILEAPQEYGFYANVNPEVKHPRWSQARERRLGELLGRPTLMFNGYGDQVTDLYSGMDLQKSY